VGRRRHYLIIKNMCALKSKKKKPRKWSGRGTRGDLMKRGLGVAELVAFA